MQLAVNKTQSWIHPGACQHFPTPPPSSFLCFPFNSWSQVSPGEYFNERRKPSTLKSGHSIPTRINGCPHVLHNLQRHIQTEGGSNINQPTSPFYIFTLYYLCLLHLPISYNCLFGRFFFFFQKWVMCRVTDTKTLQLQMASAHGSCCTSSYSQSAV